MSDIYLSLTETPSVVTLSQPVISGALSSTVTVANTVTVALDANSLSALENVTVTVGAAVSVSNFPATQVVSGSVAVTTMPALSIGSVTISNFPSTQTIAGTVTVGGFSTVSVGGVLGSLLVGGKRGSSVESLALDTATGYLQTKVESMPAISGTVTANLSSTNLNSVTIGVRGSVTASIENSVTIASLPAISGTVTANVDLSPISNAFKGNGDPSPDVGVQISWWDDDADESRLVRPSQPLPISGTVTANSLTDFYDAPNDRYLSRNATFVEIGVDEFMPVGINYSLPISGTVTANLAKPTWTDYSGSVTTAGTAVTAISGTSRSYLLAQVTTGQMFLNIGATATTSNSVYFSAGQGFAWETTVPQGIVSIISTVTGTKYVLKSG